MSREQRAETLDNAARAMEVRGKATHVLLSREGQVCAVGAIGVARGWDTQDLRNEDCRIYAEAEDVWGGAMDYLVRFNDRRSDTQAEVVFLLRWRAEEIRDGR